MKPHEANGRVQWVGHAVERFERPLVQYAERLLGDPDRARDAVQDTFLRLCKQDRAALDGHLRQWLFTVCRNRVMDEFRRRKSMSPESSASIDTHASPGPGPAEVIESKEAATNVLRAVDGLPDREREVVHLRYRGGLSYKEIAAVTGHSLSYVGVLLYTAMKRLRETLGSSLELDGRAQGARGATR